MSFTAADHRHMSEALKLARNGLYTTDPNPSVGCLIVDDNDQVVGSGWHERAGKLHAEPLALQEAGERARGATAYVTLEPCSHHGRTPPCADQLVTAGIRRVVYAMEDPNPIVSGAGEQKLVDAGLEVSGGLMAAEAEALNEGYAMRMRSGRPFVRSKLATSIDGRTALGNGESQWITGAEARADVHRWRARSSAVLTGSGTVLGDNPSLNARPNDVAAFVQPLRIVLDSGLRTPPDAQLLQIEGDVLICHCDEDAGRQRALEAAGAELLQVPACGPGEVELIPTLALLGERGLNDIWLEAGALLNAGFLNDGLIDELIVYQSGCILGDQAKGMFSIPALVSMDTRPEFNLAGVRQVGQDLRTHWRPVRS